MPYALGPNNVLKLDYLWFVWYDKLVHDALGFGMSWARFAQLFADSR